MNADLDQQVILNRGDRCVHAQRRGQRAVWRRKSRHHRIADCFDHCARLGGDDLVEHAEMRADKLEGGDIADAIVKLSRAFQIGEQKGQAGELEPLIDVERIGAIDVAEDLVGQQPLGSEERLSRGEQVVQRDIGNPDRRQRAHIGAVLDRQS